MQGHVGPIESLTEGNRDYRRVLFTGGHMGGHMQLVLMALKPGEEIGAEVHATHDQFFRIEKGHRRIHLDGERTKVAGGDAVLVPAGVRHNLINSGKRRLQLYTLYAPPEHADGLVEETMAKADKHRVAWDVAAGAEQARKDMIDEGSPVTPVVTAGRP